MKNLKKFYFAAAVISSFAGMSAALVGCGAAPTAVNTGQVQQPGIPNWQNWQQCQMNPALCNVSAGMNPSCMPMGEVIDSAARTLKKYQCSPLMGMQIPITNYRLGPNYANSYSSFYTNTFLKVGDRVEYNFSGGFNYKDGPFAVITDCSRHGLSHSAGLYLSEGTNLIHVTGNGSFVAQNEGMLRLGMNLPQNTTMSCSTISTTKFIVLHCEDSAGTTYPCP